ncbi:AAA family ATPase, partial [Seohaeicola saemankumensis]
MDTEGETFDLSVLGGFHLRRSGKTIDIPTGKVACLLTYLACTAPGPQPREKLATLLWGSSSEDRARHNLRQALAKLRQILGQNAIVNDYQSLRLSSGTINCDAVFFDQLIQEGTPSSLAAAVDLFKGAFLEDIFVDEEEWSDWLQIERERFMENAISAMVKHGESLLVAGYFAQAVSLGRRAVALNRFREDAHRLIMKGFIAAGRNSEVLTHYLELSNFLKSDLSTEPSEETRLLVDDLGRHRTTPKNAIPEAPLSPAPGTPTPAAPDPAPAASDASERRNVTVLVCNFVRSNKTTATIDPEDVQEYLLSFQKSVSDIVSKLGGYIATFSGNAVHVYFGYPRANLHEAAQAVRAGLAIVAMGRRLHKIGQMDLQISVGIASGAVIVSDSPCEQLSKPPSVFGEAPGIATQLQAVADPGAVLVSQTTRLLLGEMFEVCLREADTMTANFGASVWRVLSEKVGLSRFELERGKTFSPLVGRDDELDTLNRLWDRAKRGAGQIALITGEAGIGKSRLAEALVASVESGPHVLLRYQCSPYHTDSAFHPVIQHIVTTAGFTPNDSNDIRLDKLEALLSGDANGPIEDDSALLAQLLGLDCVARYGSDTSPVLKQRKRTLTTLIQRLERLTLQHPVLWLVEDAHWIDPTTLDLID